MGQSTKERLVSLGAETLAALLIELAAENEMASNKVQRLISSKSQNTSNFKSRLKSLIGNKRRLIPWKYSSEFASELSDLLSDIKDGAATPEEGLSLVETFFKADEHIFNMVDDSSGSVGDIFRSEAFDLFADFARKGIGVLKTTFVHLTG